MIPYLIITDANGNAYSYPTTFQISKCSLNASTNMLKYAYGSGGKQVGDGFYNYRLITIEGALIEDNPTTFESSLRTLVSASLRGGQLQIISDKVNRYIQVKVPDIDYEWEFFQISKTLSIIFIAEFPFWQDVTALSSVNVMTGNGTFTVDGSGSDYLMMPVITVAADQGVDVPSIKITNMSDGGMSFYYNDSQFTAGSTLVIDSAAGTVKLNSNDRRISLLSNSVFLRLQPMSNSFAYEGAACTITVAWRRLYI